MVTDEPYVLAVGSIAGDDAAGTHEWMDTITALHFDIEARSRGVVTPVRLDVACIIPGKYVPEAGFEGVRTGYFDKATRRLAIQMAIPREEEDQRAVVLRLLFSAIDCAEASMKRRAIAGDLGALREILAALEVESRRDPGTNVVSE